MSQHDYDVANQSGAAVRSDLNSALTAIATWNSGATAPSTTFARMRWADTTTGTVKRRNAANSAWIVESTDDESFLISRASNTILDISDKGKTIRATASFTQTFDAAATLGDGWEVDYIIDSGVTTVFDPNSTEQIDGATTKSVVGPASLRIKCDGSALRTMLAARTYPTQQVFTSGSGTYTTPAGVTRIKVRMVGGGGGGEGGGGSPTNAGTDGGDTTFSTLTAGNGIGGGATDQQGQDGGTASGGDVNIPGGGSGSGMSIANANNIGGTGGASAFGGGGRGAPTSVAGGTGQAYGSGGGGGSLTATGAAIYSGAGGSAGGYVEKTITAPAATYAYAVGAAGTGGTAGASGTAGGDGKAGIIIVEEFYD